MKIKFIFLPILVLIFFLSACAGDGVDVSEDGFDFTDEGAADSLSEEGFDFTEEEAVELPPDASMDFSDDEGLIVEGEKGFDISEEESDIPVGMEFNEDEAVEISVERKEVYPPEGTSNWLFDHDEVIATCSGNVMTISEPESELLKITLGVESASLLISELYADNQVFYSLDYANENAAQYYGLANIEGIDHHYVIQFVSLENTMIADFLVGSLKAEIEECVLTRAFSGYLVDVE